MDFNITRRISLGGLQPKPPRVRIPAVQLPKKYLKGVWPRGSRVDWADVWVVKPWKWKKPRFKLKILNQRGLQNTNQMGLKVKDENGSNKKEKKNHKI